MVRVFARAPTLLAAVTLASLMEQQTTAMTMQLHRLPEHNIHPETYSRRLTSEEDEPELVPLHLGLGTHYTWVYAGTPPQRASVIADTGSALMAFPCSGCDGCGNHTDQPFEANNSSTLVHVTCSSDSFFQCRECLEETNVCGISQTYLEGSSWKASVVEDVVYLGGDSSFDNVAMRNQFGTHFQFGCQSSETGLFVTQVADGIMGLSNTDKHIVAKLHRENKIQNNLFSLCFAEKGGTMSVGHPNKLAHRGEISYAKVISDRSTNHFYNVNMKDIRIGGKSINAKEEAYTRGHYIVDSGTTDSYLPRLLKTEFLEAFKEVAGRDYQVGSSCTSFTKDELSSLPTIQLVMEAYGDDGGEVILDVPPEQYILNSDGKFCGNIYLSENAGGVIGANIMMNRDVIFDLGNQRVGFVDADCIYKEDLAAKMSTTRPPPSSTNATSGSLEQEENNLVPAKTTVTASTTAPKASTATPTSAPTPEATPVPTPAATAASTPAATETPTSTLVATASSTPASTSPSTPEPTTSIVATTEPTATSTPEPTNVTTEVTSELNATPLSEDAKSPGTQPSSSSSSGAPINNKGGSSNSTHPMVLTIVGAVLVVGFLLMMLISVSRRRQNSGKEALWSRVKGSEEDEDDDDEEEFGLVRKDKMPAKMSTKHQRLEREDEDDDDHSSSDEEDEVFDRKNLQNEESKVDPRTLERL